MENSGVLDCLKGLILLHSILVFGTYNLNNIVMDLFVFVSCSVCV